MLDKRSFILGMFLSQARDGVSNIAELRPVIEQLCRSARMTPLTQEEGIEVGEFLQYVGDLMERSYDDFMTCQCRCHIYAGVEHVAPCCKFSGKLKPRGRSCWE